MRIVAPGLLILLAAFTPPPPPDFAYADRAGNRYEAVMLSPGEAPEGESATACARDGHCLLVRRDGASWRLHLFPGRPAPGQASAMPLAIPGPIGDDETLALWPHLVREAGGAILFGVVQTRATAYSGGGASAGRLTLLRFDPSAAMALTEVLDVPIAGSALIRACFTPADARRRAGVCHDEYELRGDLTLDPANAAGRPRLLLTVRARTYPGRRDRDADSIEAPPLTRRDLAWWTDPGCSYRRTFAFDAAAGRYRPDAPLPDCSQYLDF